MLIERGTTTQITGFRICAVPNQQAGHVQVSMAGGYMKGRFPAFLIIFYGKTPLVSWKPGTLSSGSFHSRYSNPAALDKLLRKAQVISQYGIEKLSCVLQV